MGFHFQEDFKERVITLRQRQYGCHFFADDIFNLNFLYAILLCFDKISMNFVPKCPIDNKSTLLQITARCEIDDKPLSEPMLT